MIDPVPAFLTELTALTKKHGIAIEGCGCCGSPSLVARHTSPAGCYILNHSFAHELVYVEPGDYYWRANKVNSDG